MSSQWFKFYGGEYLSDPKMLILTASERSCWLTLLCYASMTGKGGSIIYLTEDMLMAQSGIKPLDKEWMDTRGVLEKLKKLGIVTLVDETITLINWRKRQEMQLTPAERSKRYRERIKSNEVVTNKSDESNARIEENRIEENRREEKERGVKSIKYLKKIPKEDIKKWISRFICTEKEIKSKAEDLILYCESKGKRYSNYKSFLLNALKKDFKERELKTERKIEKEKP